MVQYFERGVGQATWMKVQSSAVMSSADDMLAEGYRSGAWPVGIDKRTLYCDAEGGRLVAPMASAIVGRYQGHPDRVLGANGARYTATTPEQWAQTVAAAVQAGARPVAAYSFGDGSKVGAFFEVDANGTRTTLCLLDSFDGSTKLICGSAVVRVRCCNQLASVMSLAENEGAKIRHTASLPEKIEALQHGITTAIAYGRRVRDMYHAAEQTSLARPDAERAFDCLFPPAPEGADKREQSKAQNARDEARAAMARSENASGSSVATLWNGATWLVDRDSAGRAKPCRGGADALESMLLGSRAERVSEIQTIIQLVMRDGTIQSMPARDALVLAPSATPAIGAQILADMLS